jgi:serine/threonine protein kinase
VASEGLLEAAVAGRRGTIVDGYTLGERLNAGGSGYVFGVTPPAGRDPGFPVVMKLPAVGRGEPLAGVVGFEMELMIHPALTGPHVPRLVAAGDLRSVPYLVMELVEGRPLTDHVKAAPLPFEAVARLGACVADALQAVHAQHIVHHDLKPENVMLRPDGTAVLIDFGFAHHTRYPDLLAEEKRFAAGSAPYVSPEQLRGVRGDPRSDLFALGALLYELTIGEPPFGEPQTLAGMKDRLWRVPIPPRAVRADVPHWLQEIILRCLEPDVEARYQSAALVAFDLRNPGQLALTVRSQRLSGPGVFGQARRWWRARDPARLGALPTAPKPARVIMVAVDTSHPEDARHPSIQWHARQAISTTAEHRVMCVSIIRAPSLGEGRALGDTQSGQHLGHLARLRHWAEPLGLPSERLSLHVVQSPDPTATLVELARRNHVDLIVLGAPAPAEKMLAWWRSVASGVTAAAHCSVLVVRAPGEADAHPTTA